MGSRIEILDAGSIGRLSELAQDPGPAVRYLTAFVPSGAAAYLDDVHVEVQALVVDGKALPLVINRGEDRSTYVCSPSAHYVDYPLEEFAKRHRRIPGWLVTGLALPWASVLEAGRINGVAYVNNWLLSTNPRPGLTRPQIAALTDRLAEAHPDLAIVFRSINPSVDATGAAALRESRYRLIRSRRVYVLDPSRGASLNHENLRRDFGLLRRTPYKVIGDGDALGAQVDRLAALYRALYLEKYSRFNARFNTKFISLTLKEGILTYRGLERDGRIDAFVAWFEQNDYIIGSLVGYDIAAARELGLLRLAFALMVSEAIEKKLLLNLSAGVGEFKMLRGAAPCEEYDAVFDRHLPPHRRLAWAGLAIRGALKSRRRKPMPPGRRRP